MRIAIFGKTGSGKTTVAEYLVSNHGYVRCSSGATCRKVCLLLFKSEAKAILNRVTDSMRLIDKDVWLNAALADVYPNEKLVFDGMRYENDYLFLKAHGFSMWRISASLETRITRLQTRNQAFDPAQDDKHPSETELDAFNFDYEIWNDDNDVSRLYSTINGIIRMMAVD